MTGRIIQTVSVKSDVFPWKLSKSGKKLFDYQNDIFLEIKDEPYTFGYSLSKDVVEFMFFEGADLDKVMLFKLAWG